MPKTLSKDYAQNLEIHVGIIVAYEEKSHESKNRRMSEFFNVNILQKNELRQIEKQFTEFFFLKQ